MTNDVRAPPPFSAKLVEEVEIDWSSEEYQKEQELSTADSRLQGETRCMWISECFYSFSPSLPLSLSPLPPSLHQDFCSSESNSIAGEIKVVTEPDHLSPIKEVLQLLNLLHGYIVQGDIIHVNFVSSCCTC